MLARLMNLDELACVGKSMEDFQVLQFIYNARVRTRFASWDKSIHLYYFRTDIPQKFQPCHKMKCISVDKTQA